MKDKHLNILERIADVIYVICIVSVLTIVFSVMWIDSCYPAVIWQGQTTQGWWTAIGNIQSDNPNIGQYSYVFGWGDGEDYFENSQGGYSSMSLAIEALETYATAQIGTHVWSPSLPGDTPPDPDPPPGDNTLGNIKIIGIDNAVIVKYVLDKDQFSYLIGLMLSAIFAAAWSAHL